MGFIIKGLSKPKTLNPKPKGEQGAARCGAVGAGGDVGAVALHDAAEPEIGELADKAAGVGPGPGAGLEQHVGALEVLQRVHAVTGHDSAI